MNPTERQQLAAAEAAPFAVIGYTTTRDSQGYGLTDFNYWATTHQTEAEARAAFAIAKAKIEPRTSEMQGSRRIWTVEECNLYRLYGQDGEEQLDGADAPHPEP